MTNIFSLLSINDNPKRQPFFSKKAKQKVVWYEVTNAVDPLTNQSYGNCKYKILYVNNKPWVSTLVTMDNRLIGNDETGKRFYKELINYLDTIKFNKMLNLS